MRDDRLHSVLKNNVSVLQIVLVYGQCSNCASIAYIYECRAPCINACILCQLSIYQYDIHPQ